MTPRARRTGRLANAAASAAASALVLLATCVHASGARAGADRVEAAAWIYGGRAWTDLDGDGLSECGPASPILHDVGDTIAVDVWIDTGTFEWYSFAVYLQWEAAVFEFAGVDYLVAGGQNFTPDVWTDPEAVGVFGNGYAISGTTAIARVYLRYVAATSGCIFPLIDPSYWAEIWSQCYASGGNEFFFRESSSSCVDPFTSPR